MSTRSVTIVNGLQNLGKTIKEPEVVSTILRKLNWRLGEERPSLTQSQHSTDAKRFEEIAKRAGKRGRSIKIKG
ncbi:unnamed protein product, partial [Dovyalis caffra]